MDGDDVLLTDHFRGVAHAEAHKVATRPPNVVALPGSAGARSQADDRAQDWASELLALASSTDPFIAGSSVFPTSGFANPTLTLEALALRLADHLKRLAGMGA